MYFVIVYALAVLVMIYISVKKGSDRSVIRNNASAALSWVALTLLTLYGALWLVFGVGEITAGDLSGLSHLIPAVLIYTLTYLCWRRPFEGGISLMVAAIISGIIVIPTFLANSSANYFSLLIGVLPSLAAGSLLLFAWLIARRSERRHT